MADCPQLTQLKEASTANRKPPQTYFQICGMTAASASASGPTIQMISKIWLFWVAFQLNQDAVAKKSAARQSQSGLSDFVIPAATTSATIATIEIYWKWSATRVSRI